MTAAGRNAVEAEVLAKAGLLGGPAGARRLLARHGGVLQHDDARVEVVERAHVVRLPRRAPGPVAVPLAPGPGAAA